MSVLQRGRDDQEIAMRKATWFSRSARVATLLLLSSTVIAQSPDSVSSPASEANSIALTTGTTESSRDVAEPRWTEPWTALTLAPDGSWGVGSGGSVAQAIASAVTGCKITHQLQVGCGGYLRAIQRGWALGVRCGDQNIIVAERRLADAERAVVKREIELREVYLRHMAPCVRLVTVTPAGAITAAVLGFSDGVAHGPAVTTRAWAPIAARP